MAHSVICSICQTRFDRDEEAYVMTSKRRYAHAACGLRNGYKETDVIDPTVFVQCRFCKQIFDKTKEPFKIFSNGSHAHLSCFEADEKRVLTDEEKLERYIMELFKIDYINPRIKKQIKHFVNDCGFTYTGIHKALVYYYEVKHGDIEKANNGIAIVEYIYTDAFNYYYSIWLAGQANANKNISDYIPKIKEVSIPIPQRKTKKRKLFAFLDEEEL